MIENFIAQNRTTITKQYLGSIQRYAIKNDVYYFYDINSCVEVKVVSDEIIRVRLAPHGTFLEEFSYALQPYDFTVNEVTFQDTELAYIVATPVVKLTLEKENFLLSFSDVATGLLVNQDSISMHWEENVEFGGYYVFSQKKIQTDENFYGLGDKAHDLNLIHKRFSFWSTDAYAFERYSDPLYRNIPFFTGLHNGFSYGLFYDNTYRTHFDFGSGNHEVFNYTAEGGELQYYYIHGPHMMDVTKRFSYLTGTHPMPPMWALGYHQCRWSYYPESKVREIAETFREKQIPCDAIYLDIDYMDGFRCFTWNKTYFPDPAKMIGDLKADGFQTVVIIDPGIKIDNDYPIFVEGKEKGYFCRRGDDYYMEGPVWPGRCQFPDYTNPAVREWWGSLFDGLLEQGVAGIWNDMNEPSVFGMGTFPNDVRHHYDGHKGSHRKAHNVYGMQMVRATYEGLKKLQKNKRPFTITRSAYAGVQRYSSAWTGDNIATWDHLHLASVMCQRMSMSGLSFVGSDIGGFTGEPDGELFTRWIQLGVFHPLMRAHSAGDTADREPWSFGPYYEDICRKFIELRYKLLPYIYSAFWENHKWGFPILRPIIMLEQEINTNTYRQDEFTFGDKILVCPVFESGASGRTVYLPKGLWYHYWTNKTFDGGHEHWVEAPLESMPIFVKAGAVIPEYPLMQYTRQFEIKELTLNIYYADYTVNSFMYEDHGDTFAYEQDIYTEKKFLYECDSKKITITQSAVGHFTPRYDTYFIRLIGIPFKVKCIRVDGNEVTSFSSPDTEGTVTFTVLKSFNTIEIDSKKSKPTLSK